MEVRIYEIEGVEKVDGLRYLHLMVIPLMRYTRILNNIKVAFLPRHGRGHPYSPSTVPYQANLYAMKYLGVTDVLAISACGSLREDFKPGIL